VSSCGGAPAGDGWTADRDVASSACTGRMRPVKHGSLATPRRSLSMLLSSFPSRRPCSWPTQISRWSDKGGQLVVAALCARTKRAKYGCFQWLVAHFPRETGACHLLLHLSLQTFQHNMMTAVQLAHQAISIIGTSMDTRFIAYSIERDFETQSSVGKTRALGACVRTIPFVGSGSLPVLSPHCTHRPRWASASARRT